MWDLNYKHLHILFTLQVALFCIAWVVGVTYMDCYTLFWLNMCFRIQCHLHEAVVD